MSVKDRISRIMLVYPNQRWLKQDLVTTWNLSPYGICLLATMLKDRYQVKVLDCQFRDLSLEQFRRELEDFAPQVVGLSLLTSEYAPILDLAAEVVKSISPQIITIAGGVHVTTQYFKVMKNHQIDYAVRGEGERVLRQFLDFLNGDASKPEKGLVWRDETAGLVALEPDRIEDLDALPLPDYGLLDYRAYTETKPRYGVDSPIVFPYARILTSRGCPIGCAFCQVKHISGNKWRPRSARAVVDEITWLVEEYGIKSFIIEDDNAFVDRARTKEMLRLLIERGLNLKWKAAGVPIFRMDEETFDLMAQSGCQMIGVAIESGVPRILKQVISKPVDLDQVPGLIALAKSRGIFVAANFIIGFPDETWDEIRQTLRFAETCGADYVKIYAAQPLVGTKLFDMAKELGVLQGEETTVDWRYGRIATDQFTPKDISILRCYEWDRINFSDPDKRRKTAAIMDIDLDELTRIRKETRGQLTF